jgi:hypothetical protein
MLGWSSNLGNFKTKQQLKKLQSQSICSKTLKRFNKLSVINVVM